MLDKFYIVHRFSTGKYDYIIYQLGDGGGGNSCSDQIFHPPAPTLKSQMVPCKGYSATVPLVLLETLCVSVCVCGGGGGGEVGTIPN